jgi:negative regulator of flagellin synthesis FlgM
MSTTDISGIRSGGRIDTERKDKASDTSSSNVESSSRTVSDSVEFSAAAHQLSSLQDELASLDAVDMGKVDEIRQAISNGGYKIDTQKIAESLLALEGEFAQR